MLIVTYAECHIQPLYAECNYAECRYAECRGATDLESFSFSILICDHYTEDEVGVSNIEFSVQRLVIGHCVEILKRYRKQYFIKKSSL